MKSILTWMLAGILLAACSSPENSSTETPKDVVPVSTIELKAEQLQPVVHTSGVFTTD
ncbi:MAG TPA: efflux RND transporter periplasmic adaptor subunit, partial [Cytophagales bacterium]|nr:efflux RND transporter periplasmic adaptor subunit [Cytophagales bacterium]